MAWNPLKSQLAVYTEGDVSILSAMSNALYVEEGRLLIWDLWTQEGVMEIDVGGAIANLRMLAWSPDGTQIATNGPNRSIRIWDVASGELVTVIETPFDRLGELTAVAWSPDGLQIAAGSDKSEIGWWEVESGLMLHYLEQRRRKVSQQ